MRDVTRAGRELGRRVVDDLPVSLSVGELLEARIRAEVAAYNDDPGPVFVGLVQPADSIRHSDGYRMRTPRPLDADVAVVAAHEAVEVGMLSLQVEISGSPTSPPASTWPSSTRSSRCSSGP